MRYIGMEPVSKIELLLLFEAFCCVIQWYKNMYGTIPAWITGVL